MGSALTVPNLLAAAPTTAAEGTLRARTIDMSARLFEAIEADEAPNRRARAGAPDRHERLGSDGRLAHPRPARRLPVPAGMAEPGIAVASAAFLAQHIAQERMPSGLNIEPWRELALAYGRAVPAAASVDLAV